MRHNMALLQLLLLLLMYDLGSSSSAAAVPPPAADILVVGSVNMDITVDVARLPQKGETTTSSTPSASLAVGGKGANQAVAAARLSSSNSSTTAQRVRFISRFGNDSYAAQLRQELVAAGVDVSGCVSSPQLGSGLGLVMLEPDGAASSVVVGGANTAWEQSDPIPPELLTDVGVVLLQREVPEHVNLAAAQAAAAAGIPVLLDAGGTDRPLPPALLPLLTYLCPNELELQALTGGLSTDTQEQVVAAARSLIESGVSAVLVTLSERGAVLVVKNSGESANASTANTTVISQDALSVPGGAVVDGTAAGDAFRAAFAVGLVEGWPLQQCLQFAAAAGAVAVSRKGALPSLPTLAEVVAHIHANADKVDAELLSGLGRPGDAASKRKDPSAASEDQQSCGTADTTGGTCSSSSTSSSSSSPASATASSSTTSGAHCPLKFASRLNSMQARRDLVTDKRMTNNLPGWITRQSQIKGLSLVDLNYPQHFEGVQVAQVHRWLQQAGLGVGAINIRFPSKFLLGAFTNPDPRLRAAAVQLAADGCSVAAALGATQLVVWSPYDGYDHNLQVDYDTTWQHTVQSYRQLAVECTSAVRVSLEFKPTDPATRFSIVSTTAAAILLTQDVAQPNVGLTLDIGHLLLAGENPAHSIFMAARAGKLFGLHLNDAHVKLGAEDGLPFGSVNPIMALEVVLQLQKVGYTGHIYFDTFASTMDPVAEAEWNIKTFRALWQTARQLSEELGRLSQRHDGLGVLELLSSAVLPEDDEDDDAPAVAAADTQHDQDVV